MKPVFTPNPWHVQGEDQYAAVLSEVGLVIAETAHVHGTIPELWEEIHLANMHLISAAPDMYKALELCVALIPGMEIRNWPPGWKMKDAAMSAATAALKKARGE